MGRTNPNMLLVLASFAVVGLVSADWDSLGRAISPFSGELDQRSFQTHVLDLGKLRKARLGPSEGLVRTKVLVTPDVARQDLKVTSKGFDEFLRKVEAKAKIKGAFKVFKAKVTSHYKFEEAGRTDYFYSRFSSVVQKGHIRVNAATDADLQSLVFPRVQSDFDRMTPQQVYRAYGSHVTTGIIIGGSLTLWSSSVATKFKSERDFQFAAEASYKLVLKGSASLTTKERRESSKLRTEEGLLVRGGNVALANGKVDQWVASVAKNAEEVSFLEKGVVPIWRLMRNKRKAAAMKAWYEKVLGSRTFFLKVFRGTPFAKQQQVTAPEARTIVDEGWKVISGGASVKFRKSGQMLTKSCPIIEGGVPVGWEAKARFLKKEDRGQIEVYAVAIHDPFDEWDVKVVRTASTKETLRPTRSATLPSGYTLTGGGAALTWKRGTPGQFLVGSYPPSSRTWTGKGLQQVYVTRHKRKRFLRKTKRWTTRTAQSPGRVTTFAIGIKHRSGQFQPKFRHLQATVGDLQHPSGTVRATGGYSIAGGGALVLQRPKQALAFLTHLSISDGGKSFFAKAKDHIVAGKNAIRVYGVELQGAAYYASPSELLGRETLAGFRKMMSRKRAAKLARAKITGFQRTRTGSSSPLLVGRRSQLLK